MALNRNPLDKGNSGKATLSASLCPSGDVSDDCDLDELATDAGEEASDGDVDVDMDDVEGELSDDDESWLELLSQCSTRWIIL